jgi:phosphate transport system permease protein
MSSAASTVPEATPISGALFQVRKGEITQAPTGRQRFLDAAFRKTCYAFAWLTVALVAFIVVRILIAAVPAIKGLGPGFLTGRVWDANAGNFGILAEIWGTLYTSILALIVGSLFGVAAAVFLSEGFLSSAVFNVLRRFHLQLSPVTKRLPDQIERLLKELIELLAAIPSVVYGLWGIFVVIPLIRPYCDWLHTKLGWIPLFSTDLSGPGVLPAVLVLSIMILPTITAISRDALVAVPPKLRMAAYGLGATRWEAIFAVILPTAARGIFGGIVLAFGRALGETMALAMLVGNSNQIKLSLFSPANTLAALLANNFPEAGPKEVGILMYAALVLLAITLVVNILGAFILQRASLAHAE